MKEKITELTILQYVSRNDSSYRLANKVYNVFRNNDGVNLTVVDILCLGRTHFRSLNNVVNSHFQELNKLFIKDQLPYPLKQLVDRETLITLSMDEKINLLKINYPDTNWDNKIVEQPIIEDLKVHQYIAEKIALFDSNIRTYQAIRTKIPNTTIADIRRLGEENIPEVNGIGPKIKQQLKAALASDGRYLPLESSEIKTTDTVTIQCSQEFFKTLQAQESETGIDLEKMKTFLLNLSDKIQTDKEPLKGLTQGNLIELNIDTRDIKLEGSKTDTVTLQCSQAFFEALQLKGSTTEADHEKSATFLFYLSDKIQTDKKPLKISTHNNSVQINIEL